ncbi:MAG: transposase [Ignavibacteria bacterium]|nr:transposase [Ignavibacteria bacterium]
MKYIPNQYYHVYNRGAHKSPIYFSDDNYRYCINLLHKYSKRYRVNIGAFCLMPNHYHLIVRHEENGSIARFLQTTFNAYTQALNKQRSLSGTLFEGRAKGIPVDSDQYLLQLVRYLHLNPVVARLVKRAEDWAYSDCADWIKTDFASQDGNELRSWYFQDGLQYQSFLAEYQHELEQQILTVYLDEE